ARSRPIHCGAGGGRAADVARAERRRGESAARRAALERDAAPEWAAGPQNRLRLLRSGDPGARPVPVAGQLPAHGRAGVRSLSPDGARGDGRHARGGMRGTTRNTETRNAERGTLVGGTLVERPSISVPRSAFRLPR